MPRLFFGNFDFEHQLAEPKGWRTPTNVKRLLAERATAWIALAETGDFVWTPEEISNSFWEELAGAGLPHVHGICDVTKLPAEKVALAPWGWSPQAEAQFGKPRVRGGGGDVQMTRPEFEVVRLGNSRAWSFEVEQSLGVALPGAARVERFDEFAETVTRSARHFDEKPDNHAWVIKANYGMAGRERILGRGRQLTEAQQNWLQRRLVADKVVFFEPWLRVVAEVGLQFEVPTSGQEDARLIGVTPLICDSRGSFRGSGISSASTVSPDWLSAVETGLHVTRQLQQLGYFGPVGIDAAIYEDACGKRITRPLQDINVRFTMGRLALGFRRVLRPGESAVWWHVAREQDLPRDWPPGARVIRTSPPVVGNQPTQHRSLLVIQSSKFRL